MVLIGIIILVSLAAGAAVTYLITQPVSSVPSDIRKDLEFSPLVPVKNTGEISASSFKISSSENDTQTLSYILQSGDATVTVTQQTQPSQFVDIPEYKERFLSGVVKQYKTVQTTNGVIYLGKGDKEDSMTLAVMLEKGLLVFMNPSTELNDSEWRTIGDSLTIEKTTN